MAAGLAIAGCNSEPPLPELTEEEAAQLEAIDKKKELRAQHDKQRVALTREGQGCPGRVLRDGELRDAVAGKNSAYPNMPVAYDGPSSNRTYHTDGSLSSGAEFGHVASGRYWISGDQLCHKNLHGSDLGEGDTPRCVRLIVTPDNKMMEERLNRHADALNERIPGGLRLICGPIELSDIEAGG